MLGLKPGDKFVSEDVSKHLRDNISTLYLDNGYVFSKVDFTQKQIINGKVDLDITIFEGTRAKIGEIIVKGNVTVPTKDVLQNIKFKSGDFFSKAKIINSVRALAAMGKFDPEKINPRPIPQMGKTINDYAIVDIEFVLTETNKK